MSSSAQQTNDLDALLARFTAIRLERVNPAKNENQFCFIAWQPTLSDASAVVPVYGRKDERQWFMAPVPFDSLDAAWPFIRATLRRRAEQPQPVLLTAM